MALMQRTCNFGRMNVERIVARAFVIVGGAFWAFAALLVPYGNRLIPVWWSVGYSVAVLVVVAGIFVLGMFYETLAGAILLVAAAAMVVVALVSAGDNIGVWGYLGTLVIAPTAVAGVLYLLAARMQNVCELSEAK